MKSARKAMRSECGKPKMVALVAAMAKLLRIMYGVFKSGKPFDPSLAT
jgi:hypothetical protein